MFESRYRGTLAATLVLAVTAAPLHAGHARKSGASASARIQRLTATHWRICIPGYITTAAPAFWSYAAAGIQIPAASPITSAGALTTYRASDGTQLGRYTWTKNGSIAAKFAALKSGGTWSGFHGAIWGPVAANTEILHCFDVTTAATTTWSQMNAAVKACVFGIDDSDAARNLKNTTRDFMQPTIVIENACGRSEKTFYNGSHTNAAARNRTTNFDDLYFMQPAEFRAGYGGGTGWRGAFQDEDASTSERLTIGFLKFKSGSSKPDISPAGLLTAVRFDLFGTGTGRKAFLYTLTTAVPAPLTQSSGIKLQLPKPTGTWPSDGMSVHVQTGSTLALKAALRSVWSWARLSADTVPFGPTGTVMRVGGLYEKPTMQPFVTSTAYGPSEDLYGPEALHPDSKRGDRVGFRVHADCFRNKFVLLMLGPGYRASPFPTPWGPVLMKDFLTAGSLAVDANGIATTPAVPVPPGLTFGIQSMLVDFLNGRFEFTDASLIRVQ